MPLSVFQRYGLLNTHSVDFGELATNTNKKNLAGFCTGTKCCEVKLFDESRNKHYIRYKSRVLKTTNTDIDECPECNSILVWRENAKIHHVKAESGYKNRSRSKDL